MKKKKGFTLIEIIVSLAIIGMLAVIFLPVFTMTIKGIFTAGRRNDTTFQSQNDTEYRIGDTEVVSNATLIITFGSNDLNITGEDITYGSLEYFIPE